MCIRRVVRGVTFCLLAGVCVLYTGCSSSQQPVAETPVSGEEIQQEKDRVEQQVAALMAEGKPAQQQSQKTSLLIQPGDGIKINVWLQDRISQLSGFPLDSLVPESGELFLPHLGMIQAAGKTISALKADLQFNFDKILSEAFITVTQEREKIAGGDSRTKVEVGNHFIILGYIARPGVFPITAGLRLRDGIALAGGFKRYALKNVFLVRGDRDEPVVLKINLDKIMQGTDLSENVILLANDAIYVPPKKLWEISDFVTMLLMPIVSVRDAMWVIDRVSGE